MIMWLTVNIVQFIYDFKIRGITLSNIQGISAYEIFIELIVIIGFIIYKVSSIKEVK